MPTRRQGSMPAKTKAHASSGASAAGSSNGVGNSKKRAYEDFVMTLDSDDEVDAGTESGQESGDENQANKEALDETLPATSASKSAPSKATLATRQKVLQSKAGKGTAARTQIDSTGEQGPAIDRSFTFDLGDGFLTNAQDGWDMSVQGAKGANGHSITVDDIIEKRRKARPDLVGEIEDEIEADEEHSEDEDEDEEEIMKSGDDTGDKLEFTGFDDSDDNDVQSSEDNTDDDEDESLADSLEFGAGVRTAADASDASDEVEDDALDGDDDAEEEDFESSDKDDADSASASDSEEETEVQRAKKAAFFAAESSETHKSDTKESSKKVTFQSLDLSRQTMRALSSLNFHTPTPIQGKSIPIALAGKDIVAGAVTGSGKTAAFLIPILERLAHRPRGSNEAKTRVLILMPTRELAVQCVSVGRALAKFTDVRFCLCVGGLSLKVQESQLKGNPDIVVATPGRLIDHVRNSASFGIDDVEILVMDEADRMLEEGFQAELDEIIKATPKSRQTMLFSATMTDDVDELVRLSMRKPVKLFVDPRRSTAQNLVQEFVRVRGATGVDAETSSSSGKRTQEETRAALLLSLCLRTFREQVIIFVRSKKLAHQLRIVFGLLGLRAGELHGDLSQDQRLQSLQGFKDGHVDYLLATDLASRGLDIKGVQTVINFDMPAQLEMYLHRVGRTARAGRQGRSVTLVGEADRKLLKVVLKRSPAEQIRHRLVPVETVVSVAERLAKLKAEVERVLHEEKEDKMLRQAEMQVTKGENLIKHHDEIMSRPRRTWFTTEKDKSNQKDLARAEHLAKIGMLPNGKDAKAEGKKKDKYAGMSRKKRRSRMARDELEADKAQQGSVNASIRQAKRAAQPKALGVPDAKPQQKPKSSHKAKTQKTKTKESGGGKVRSSTSQKERGKSGAMGASGFRKDLGSHGTSRGHSKNSKKGH